MKYGFSLIELMIATALSSMIAALLVTALYQGSRSQTVIDSVFDTSLRVGIVNNILERDLMGAFVPTQARIKDEKEDQEDAEDKKASQKKETDTKKTDTKKDQADEKQKVSKPAEKPLEKIFYGTRKGENLDVLTFITNNPLEVYVGKDSGVAKPKVVRVQYRLQLENEKESKDTFVLVRQESTELDLSKFNATRAYEVIGGIKSCVVKYTARMVKKEEQKKNATPPAGAQKEAQQKGAKPTADTAKQNTPPKTYDYKTMQDWVSERPQEDNKKEEETLPRVPYRVEIRIRLWNKKHTKEQEFTLSFELPVDTMGEQKEDDDKQQGDDKKSASSSKKSGLSTIVSTTAETTSNKKVASNDPHHLVDSLTATLGNITKALSAL
jgi:prepilin-type N-terminal cleavage/methylation domain-containing protein